MAKPLAVDNSKLKEQARQRRQEQARLQQVTEKQPTKALFGPPIPVSRPNDPTFNKLSDWFGPYETGAYRPFFSPNNDTTTQDESVDRRQTDNSRQHGDNAARHNNDALRHGDNMRHGDNRHSDARHGDAMRHGDGRQRDNLRHGDNRNIDNRNSDNRNNSRPNDSTLRNSKGSSGHGATALVLGGEGAVDPSRQGVFEQFVRTNANATAARESAQAPSLDGRHSNAMVRHGNGKAPDPTSSGVKQSLQHSDKMKNRPPTVVDRPRPDRVEESVVNQANVGSRPDGLRPDGSRPDGSRPGLPPSKSFSTPLQNSPPFLNHASPIANSGSRDARGDAKNSAWGHHSSDPSKDHEKTSRIGNPVARVNGVRVVHAGAVGKDVEMERKLTLNIPPLSGGHEKFDESFFERLREEVDIPLPLTAIMTPKKMDSSTFPFPAVLPDVSLHDHDDIIPRKGGLLDNEDDDPDDELPDDGLLLPPQHHPLLSKQLPPPHHPHHPPHPLAVPHADAPTNVLSDLEISSSDSEDEQDKETGLDERMSSPPPSRRLPPPDDMATSPAGPTDDHHHTILDRVPDSSNRSRHVSESSTSSSEGSCTSGSESGSSLSDDEGNERTTERLGQEKDDDEDENEDKQPKRPSWEISNFIPKSNGLPGLLSSSSSSPLAVNRQMSRDSDFDTDSDPLKLIGDRVLSAARLSPLPMAASAIDHLDDSDFHADITAFLSPSKDQLAPSSWGLPQIDITPPPVATARFKPAVTPPTSVTPRSTPLLLGVDYSDGEPSVVVRICRSRLSTDVAKTDGVDAGSMCDGGGTDSASDNVACRSGVARTNGKNVVARAATPSERVDCSVDLVAVDAKLSVLVRTPAKRLADVSPGRTAGLMQQQQPVARSPSLARPVDARSSSAAVDSDSRIEKSPRKVESDRKEVETSALSGKGAKRKAEDGGLGRSDQKKVCDRSGVLLSSSSIGKEDHKSQNLTQNGEPDRAKGSRPPEPTNHLKSPALISATEDSSSRSSSSQKRIEKSKSQNGYSKIEEKPKKAVAATTPCLDGSRNNVVVTEPPFVSVEKPAKPGATPMVNGVGESPAYPGTFDASEPSDVVPASRKRSAPCEEDDQPLDRRKDPVNGIRRPESLESSEFYLQQARRLKHVGDSGPDKFSKALSYIESVVAFISHCSALEQEHAEPARIQKMYQDTMALCQYIIKVIENVTNVEKHQLLVIGLRIQSVICLKLYYTRKLEIAKLKTVLDEHNKSYSSKPLQIPSPYQANHHHSANATSTVPGNWNHANGTPSPHSPRPSPSPAGSIGSVGSAGSSNGDSANGGGVGMGKPLSSSSTSLLNGHSGVMTSIVVPQRIHSVMLNYLSHTNHLYQCHESWDQADSILTTHPSVGEFFHSLDVECGPIDLHSSTPALVRYASEVVNRVRNNARRLSQATRAD